MCACTTAAMCGKKFSPHLEVCRHHQPQRRFLKQKKKKEEEHETAEMLSKTTASTYMCIRYTPDDTYVLKRTKIIIKKKH